MRSPVSRWRAGLLAALFMASPAAAQEAPPLGPLTGTLRKVREAGAIVLGHREASLPFSFLDSRGQPIGYSIDLCREIVDAVAEELGFAQLAITWRAVTPESRIRAVVMTVEGYGLAVAAVEATDVPAALAAVTVTV